MTIYIYIYICNFIFIYNIINYNLTGIAVQVLFYNHNNHPTCKRKRKPEPGRHSPVIILIGHTYMSCILHHDLIYFVGRHIL